MKKALFAGTFDPPTLGHLELIQRAAGLVDELYIGVAENSLKQNSCFSIQERKDLLQEITHNLKNVNIVSFSGLVVDFAKSHHINFLIRGLRNGSDFDLEFQMAASNHVLTGVETLFLAASPAYNHINSTLVREIARGGRRLQGFVPEIIEEKVFRKLSSLNCML